MKNKIKKAKEYATKMHEGQYRIGGNPYIIHPTRVAENVKKYKESSELDMLIAAAYLHDTLEDTKATYYDIVHEFGPSIASIVLELTTDEDMKNELGKKRYLQIKLKNMSSWALVIKLCDRLDNVNDLENCDEEFRNKYINETNEILDFIEKNRTLSNTHKKIINEIKNKISIYNKRSTQW